MYTDNLINVILVDSPVEFVLIGPVNDQLKVLVKSKNAGIDLIGFSQDENEGYYSNSSTIFLNSLTPQKISSKNAPQLYVNAVKDDRISKGYRLSIYKFVWRGVSNNRYDKIINLNFDSKLPDIINALKNQDLDSLEWSLAVIISLCNTSIKNREKNRNQMLIIAVFYFAVIVITLIFLLFRSSLFRSMLN